MWAAEIYQKNHHVSVAPLLPGSQLNLVSIYSRPFVVRESDVALGKKKVRSSEQQQVCLSARCPWVSENNRGTSENYSSSLFLFTRSPAAFRVLWHFAVVSSVWVTGNEGVTAWKQGAHFVSAVFFSCRHFRPGPKLSRKKLSKQLLANTSVEVWRHDRECRERGLCPFTTRRSGVVGEVLSLSLSLHSNSGLLPPPRHFACYLHFCHSLFHFELLSLNWHNTDVHALLLKQLKHIQKAKVW